MSPFEKLTTKAHRLVCPGCGTCSISLALRCDFGDRNCMTVATCTSCHREFDAESLSTYDELHEHMETIAKWKPCSLCGSRHRSLRSTCDRLEHECFFVVTCEECGDIITGLDG
ncbi:MAG: hypothetical protein ACE5IK_07585 [Acidobacteriota bacterium]